VISYPSVAHCPKTDNPKLDFLPPVSQLALAALAASAGLFSFHCALANRGPTKAENPACSDP
jgi:hypothetical protein